ncbi:hypothetical protein GQ607_001204 [Colletotrichum asianum]|uniref:Uncharacterized protein n=1 Tax=Colletotrichum asianum TaxID=702518 RepID=A0A8H3WUR1_9PEZI|nr:hypothetical protein GQ607_001204 [Colletotrichum asianum]
MLAHERRVVGSFAGAWRRQGNVDHVWWGRQPEGVSQRCMEHAPIGEWAWILVNMAVELVTLYLVHGRCNLPTMIGRARGINGLTKLRALGLDLLGLPSFRALHHWACCRSIGSNRPRRPAFRLAVVLQTNGSPPSFGAGTGGIDGTDDMRNKSNDGPLSPPSPHFVRLFRGLRSLHLFLGAFSGCVWEFLFVSSAKAALFGG